MVVRDRPAVVAAREDPGLRAACQVAALEDVSGEVRQRADGFDFLRRHGDEIGRTHAGVADLERDLAAFQLAATRERRHGAGAVEGFEFQGADGALAFQLPDGLLHALRDFQIWPPLPRGRGCQQQRGVPGREPHPGGRSDSRPHAELVGQAARGERVIQQRTLAGRGEDRFLTPRQTAQELIERTFRAGEVTLNSAEAVAAQQGIDDSPRPLAPHGFRRIRIARAIGLEAVKRRELLVGHVPCLAHVRLDDRLVGEKELLMDELQAFGGFGVFAQLRGKRSPPTNPRSRAPRRYRACRRH